MAPPRAVTGAAIRSTFFPPCNQVPSWVIAHRHATCSMSGTGVACHVAPVSLSSRRTERSRAGYSERRAWACFEGACRVANREIDPEAIGQTTPGLRLSCVVNARERGPPIRSGSSAQERRYRSPGPAVSCRSSTVVLCFCHIRARQPMQQDRMCRLDFASPTSVKGWTKRQNV